MAAAMTQKFAMAGSSLTVQAPRCDTCTICAIARSTECYKSSGCVYVRLARQGGVVGR